MLDRRRAISSSLTGLTAVAVGGAATNVYEARAQGGGPDSVGSKDRMFGEPLELRGKCIYFTSWKYVRPGAVGWRDGVFAPSDLAWGIRLVAQESVERVTSTTGYCHLFDKGKYKKWGGHGDGMVAYAESDDGFSWSDPQVVYTDTKHREVMWGAVSVFVDPSTDDGERYKMVYIGNPTDVEWAHFGEKYPGERNTITWSNVPQNRLAIYGAISNDGIRWKALADPLLMQPVDTQNTCYYDLDLQQYVCYVRSWQVPEQVAGWLEKDPSSWESWSVVGRRVIGRAVSHDFRHFTPPEVVVSTDADMPPTHVWYNNAKTTLPGCPDQHVMFAWLWELEHDGGDVHLLSSPDGRAWSRVPGNPVLRRGAPGSQSGGYINCQIHMLEYSGDRWGIPHVSAPRPHKYAPPPSGKTIYGKLENELGIAMWPKGRLVALQADDYGQFGTIALIPPGNKLRLNASVGVTGYIKVSVGRMRESTSVEGRSFEDARPVVGDGLRLPVTWKGGESDLKHGGRPLILRFQMRNARIFGLEFA